MKVRVDLARCEAHGECMMAAPAVFELDDADALHYEPAPDPTLRDQVQRAARSCPVQAITVDG